MRKHSIEKLVGFTDNPIKSTYTSEPEIYPPYYIHQARDSVIDKNIVGQIPTVHHLSKTDYAEANNNTIKPIQQLIASKLNQMLYILHRI